MSNKSHFIGITPSCSSLITEDEWENYRYLGIRTLRIHLQRGTFHSSENPDFSPFDQIIERAGKEDMEVILLISYESFESKSEPLDLGWGPIFQFTNPADMVPITEKAIRHFKGTCVCGYEIWNEQNGMWNLSPSQYASLICDIYEKCKYTEKWDENATIAFGGFDAVNVGFEEGINLTAKKWLEEFYQTTEYQTFRKKYKHSPFDVFCHHPYNMIDLDDNNQVNYNVLSSALNGVVLDLMEQNGDSNVPLWITEFGDQDLDEKRNAVKTEYAIKEFSKQPRVDKLIWFTYTYYDEAGAGYSLVYGNKKKRQSFEAFAKAAKEL
jgi:hypothetical protein